MNQGITQKLSQIFAEFSSRRRRKARKAYRHIIDQFNLASEAKDLEGILKAHLKEILFSMQYPIAGRRERLELVRYASFDPLTKVYQGVVFRQALETELHKLKGAQKHLRRGDNQRQRHSAILFIDLDKFKRINDTLGHVTGDYVLQQVAQLLTKTIKRSDDVIARISGDEFTVLLKDIREQKTDKRILTIEQQVEKIVKKLNEAFSNLSLEYKGKEFSIGASIGYSIIDPTKTAEENYEMADTEMYAIKKGNGTPSNVPFMKHKI